ncbi:MAG: hypothetical protein WD673_13040 [Alphaproteobacteria bacterium]
MSKDDFANGKGFANIVRLESAPVEGAPGRSIETQLWTGQMLFRNAETWSISGVDVTEMHNGKGTVRGNQVATHRDGSTMASSYSGKVKAVENSNRFVGKGEWRTTSGTGRAAGIKASGSFTFEQTGDKFTNEISGKA